MSRVLRAREIISRPVVTMAGEDVAQVKDVVYSASGGDLSGFTLAGRGMFSGPLDRALALPAVAALGDAAVMITGEDALEPVQDVLDRATSSGGPGGNALGARLLTDDGDEIGTVVDFIIRLSGKPSLNGDVIGCEVVVTHGPLGAGNHAFVPMPDALTASGEHVIVPAAAIDFSTSDFSALEGRVRDFRSHQEGVQ